MVFNEDDHMSIGGIGSKEKRATETSVRKMKKADVLLLQEMNRNCK